MVTVKPVRLSLSSASGAQNDAKDEDEEKSKMTVASPEKCCKRPAFLSDFLSEIRSGKSDHPFTLRKKHVQVYPGSQADY